jgi:hypothetical protein
VSIGDKLSSVPDREIERIAMVTRHGDHPSTASRDAWDKQCDRVCRCGDAGDPDRQPIAVASCRCCGWCSLIKAIRGHIAGEVPYPKRPSVNKCVLVADMPSMRRRITRAAATVVMAVSVVLTGVGLSAGVAEARPVPAPTWCPGEFWDPGWGGNWDWDNCHDWWHGDDHWGDRGNHWRGPGWWWR